MTNFRFKSIVLLHGKGGSPAGSVSQLEAELRRLLPGNIPADLFQRPKLLHSDPNVLAEDSLADLASRNLPKNAALIGISLGGLVAAKLQEQDRDDLHVICISSPTWADGVRLEKRMPNRIAFYSSKDEVIAGRTADWPQLSQAYDLPWLTHDTDQHKQVLASLIMSCLKGNEHFIDMRRISKINNTAEARTRTVAEIQPHSECPRILLVEDSELIRELIVPWLFEDGFDCREAADGRAAMELLASGTRIDVVLSNLLLPVIDGFALFQHVKENYPQIPFAFVTGINDPQIRDETIRRGADGYLQKPFTKDEFLTFVCRMIAKSSLQG
jgi:CheY-like chemotaxis protein